MLRLTNAGTIEEITARMDYVSNAKVTTNQNGYRREKKDMTSRKRIENFCKDNGFKIFHIGFYRDTDSSREGSITYTVWELGFTDTEGNIHKFNSNNQEDCVYDDITTMFTDILEYEYPSVQNEYCRVSFISNKPK